MPDNDTNWRTWRVGHLYRDRGRKTATDDELLHWLASGGTTIANMGGIRFRDFRNLKLVDAESQLKVPAFFVLVTSERLTQSHNPWEDIVDNRSGEIFYWGDAKFDQRGRPYNGFTGNARIEASNNLRLRREIVKVPPFLHFARVKSGWMRFNGLCVLTDVRQAWFEEEG